MIRSAVLMLLVSLLSFSAVPAQDEGFGLGVILGEPTGISWKAWTGSRTAVDGAVAWSFEKEAAIHLHADLLWHNFGPFEADRGEFNLYYGIGSRIKFEDDSRMGARVPLGLGYLFGTAPLDFFIEIVPILDLAPETDFSLNAAMGVRYFFGWKCCKSR
jgi:hypothetical protein